MYVCIKSIDAGLVVRKEKKKQVCDSVRRYWDLSLWS